MSTRVLTNTIRPFIHLAETARKDDVHIPIQHADFMVPLLLFPRDLAARLSTSQLQGHRALGVYLQKRPCVVVPAIVLMLPQPYL